MVKKIPKLPKTPGVYFFKNTQGKIIYVGKAKSLKDRVSSYFHPPAGLLPKTAQMVTEAATLEYIPVESEIDALLFEANLIRKLAPKYNVDWKDGKAYPLIEITKETVPQVHFARKETNPTSTYFGPYPTGSDLTSLLRFLRKIFPFVSQNHPGGKSCLRSHLGLCPCPDVFINHRSRRKYLSDLRNLRDFLLGKRQSLQKRLAREMLAAAQREDFEKAGEIKQKLQQIAYVTSPRTSPDDYEVNPNLLQDKRQEEINELTKVLSLSELEKIECYDIANLSGHLATGAQVVFINGEPEKSLYRRYKIKLHPPAGGQNDFAMIQEMISRRLKSDVPLPDLMVIDGGKGQLSAVQQVLKNVSSPNLKSQISNLKSVALAKRLETIYTDDGQEINLPQSSPALHLLQRLRDEAHRFSRKYHLLLRTKTMLT